MARQRQSPTPSNGLKPMPKPVRPSAPSKKRALAAAQPHTPMDPDDFQLQEYRPRRQQRPPSLWEAFVIFVKRMAKKYLPTPKQRKKGSRRIPIARLIGIGALCVVFIALTVLLIWAATNKNAYAVYLGEIKDENIVGYIARAKEMDEAALQVSAVNHLETSLGARVQVYETVSVKLVHCARSKILPDADVVDRVSRGFTYKIAATAIYVEGMEITVLKTQEEAKTVAKRLQEPYMTENTKSVEFVEKWEYVTKLVEEDELGTIEDALLQLDKKARVMEDYTIQSGDALDKIARRNNTTVEKICADNPGYSTNTVLKIGKVIQLETTKPYLSVRTVDETIRKESIPTTTKNVENPNESTSYTKVTQEGRDGEREITIRIIRVNGIQTGQEQIIATRTSLEPVERIVEIGTVEYTPSYR